MPGVDCAGAGRICRHRTQRLASTNLREGRDMGYKNADDKIKWREAKKNRELAVDEKVKSWNRRGGRGCPLTR